MPLAPSGKTSSCHQEFKNLFWIYREYFLVQIFLDFKIVAQWWQPFKKEKEIYRLAQKEVADT